MKTKIIVPVVTALVLSACTSSYLAKSGNDDLYYSPTKGSTTVQQQTENETTSVPTNKRVAEKGNTSQMSDYEKYRNSLENGEQTDTTVAQPEQDKNYADNANVQNSADSKEPVVESNDYYGDGSDAYVYNNYYYAGRINRFHGGFYDPYLYDPFYYNAWYDPWYTPGWSFSIGFGWGWGWPCYNDFYYPHFGYWGYYGYNPYWSGYNHGFYDGYWYGGGYVVTATKPTEDMDGYPIVPVIAADTWEEGQLMPGPELQLSAGKEQQEHRYQVFLLQVADIPLPIAELVL